MGGSQKQLRALNDANTIPFIVWPHFTCVDIKVERTLYFGCIILTPYLNELKECLTFNCEKS